MNLKKAVLEREGLTAMLAEGEKERNIEVAKIDYKKATVDVYVDTNKTITTLGLSSNAQGDQAEFFPGIRFDHANFNVVLELYSTLVGRTLLRHPHLPETEFILNARAGDVGEASRAIEKALSEKGIAAIPDGTLFMMIVPEKMAPTIKPESLKIKYPEPKSARDIAISFPSTPLMQAAEVYAGIFGCKVDGNGRSSPRPWTTVKFRTETSLTKEEFGYAFDTIFGSSGKFVLFIGRAGMTWGDGRYVVA